MAEPAKYYTIKTLAEKWGVSDKTVRTLIGNGKLKHIRIGSLIRIRPDQVSDFEKETETKEPCQDKETTVCDLTSARSERLTTSASIAVAEVKGYLLGRRIAQVLN